jgi:hypothetical protein
MPAWTSSQLQRFEDICRLVAAALDGKTVPALAADSAAPPVPAPASNAADADAAAADPGPGAARPVPPPTPPGPDYSLQTEAFFAGIPWGGARVPVPPGGVIIGVEVKNPVPVDPDVPAENFLGKAAWNDGAGPVDAASPAATPPAGEVARSVPAPPVTLRIPGPAAPAVPAHRNLLVAGLFSAAATSRRLLAGLGTRPDQARRYFSEAKWNHPAPRE